ncbi:MAG: sulfotransferase domain-containing protein [Pseudomonadota bacterium]
MPDFIVVGAAKSGTTSLYQLLRRHPDLFLPDIKEPEYFARDDRYSAGIESYAANFADARDDQLVGECSTIYTLSPFFPHAARRAAEHVPDAKIIYLLRQPVDRAYSFYVQIIKNYQNVTSDLSVHRTFEDFIDPTRLASAAPRSKVFSKANDHLPDEPDLCLAGSDYLLQANAWLQHFPRDQILFLKFEDFVGDRPTTVGTITDFLGISRLPDEIFDASGVTRNVAANHFRRRGQERVINRIGQRFGFLWSLRHVLPEGLKTTLKTRIVRSFSADNRHVPPKMLPATKASLTKRFKAQQIELDSITGLDTSSWWK